MKTNKVEWSVEVVNKEGKVSYKPRKNRATARTYKNSMKKRGNQARIIRNEYVLVEQGYVR